MAIRGPQNFTAIGISSSEIYLTWVNIDEYDYIQIRRDGVEIHSIGGTLQEYTWGGLSPNTEYSFEIRGHIVEPPSWTDWEGPATAKTWPSMSPPQDVEITERGAVVELTWNSVDLDCDEIEIFRSDSDHNYGETPYATTWPNVEYYQDTSPISHCWYKLRTRTGANYSDWSDEVECQNYGTPTIVDDFYVVKKGATWLVLGWDDPPLESAPVSTYKFYTWTGSSWQDYTQLPFGYNYLRIENLEPETTYKYKIECRNSQGTSSSSKEVEVTTESQETSIYGQKIVSEDFIYVATINKGGGSTIILSSGEYPGSYHGAMIENQDFHCTLNSCVLSEFSNETSGGQIVVSATKGLEEDDLVSTLLAQSNLGCEIKIEIYFPQTQESQTVIRGYVSNIEYRDHKIYISYDDLFFVRLEKIYLPRIGTEPVPMIFGMAVVSGAISSLSKKQIQFASHRIKGVYDLFINDTQIDPDYFSVDYQNGKVTLSPTLSLAEDDDIVASVVELLDEENVLNNSYPAVLMEIFGSYIDQEKISRLIFLAGMINCGLTDDISTAEFLSRLMRPEGILAWGSGDGLCANFYSLTRAPDVYFLKSEIKKIEKSYSLADRIKKAVVRYAATSDIPEENRMEQTYNTLGNDKEYEIFGGVGNAYYFLNNVLSDFNNFGRAKIEVPFLLLSLEPAQVIEIEGGDKILIEKIEFRFSEESMRIEGVII